MLTQQTMAELANRLRQQPFRYDGVFLFEQRADGELVSCTEEAAGWLSNLSPELKETLVNKCRETGNACFHNIQTDHATDCYAAIPHGRLFLFLRKRMQDVTEGNGAFNGYVTEQVTLMLTSLIGPPGDWRARPSAPSGTTPEGDGELIRLRELDDYQECRDLWRKSYPRKWLAVKSGLGVVVHAASEQRLRKRLDEMENVPFPIMIVPPDEAAEDLNSLEVPAGRNSRRKMDGTHGEVRKTGFLRRLLELGHFTGA